MNYFFEFEFWIFINNYYNFYRMEIEDDIQIISDKMIEKDSLNQLNLD